MHVEQWRFVRLNAWRAFVEPSRPMTATSARRLLDEVRRLGGEDRCRVRRRESPEAEAENREGVTELNRCDVPVPGRDIGHGEAEPRGETEPATRHFGRADRACRVPELKLSRRTGRAGPGQAVNGEAVFSRPSLMDQCGISCIARPHMAAWPSSAIR